MIFYILLKNNYISLYINIKRYINLLFLINMSTQILLKIIIFFKKDRRIKVSNSRFGLIKPNIDLLN